MKWKMPDRIKIYEALGSIADNRVKVNGDKAKVTSSSGNKSYDVIFDAKSNSITANDNGSFWQGYLGYPSIAFLMVKGLIKYKPAYADALKDIAWKDINTKYKNDFVKTINYVHQLLEEREVNIGNFQKEVDDILKQISELNLNKLGETPKPPQGY